MTNLKNNNPEEENQHNHLPITEEINVTDSRIM